MSGTSYIQTFSPILSTTLLSLGTLCSSTTLNAPQPTRPLSSFTDKNDQPNLKISALQRKNHSLKKNQKRNSHTITEKQRVCAEKLGVDPSECNQHGVFINRTNTIIFRILQIIGTSKRKNITPQMLENIKDLSILHEQIDEKKLKKNDLHGLINLQKINIQNNNIKEIHKDTFTHTPRLSEIFLINNNLSSLPPKVLSPLHNLTRIDIDGNPLIIPIQLLHEMRALSTEVVLGYFLDKSPQNTVAVETDLASVLLSDLKEFFINGIDKHNVHFIYPNQFVFQNELETLTQPQLAFLCFIVETQPETNEGSGVTPLLNMNIDLDKLMDKCRNRPRLTERPPYHHEDIPTTNPQITDSTEPTDLTPNNSLDLDSESIKVIGIVFGICITTCIAIAIVYCLVKRFKINKAHREKIKVRLRKMDEQGQRLSTIL